MIDRQFIFALDVLRLSAATRAKLLPILEAMSKELRGTLADTDATAWSKARAAAIIGDAKAIIKAHYAEAQGQLLEATEGVARVSARVAAADLDFLTPVSIEPSIAPAALLDKLAGDSLIQGAVQADWWRRQTADTTFRFASAVRQGIAAGDTNQRIIARVKQTTDISAKNVSALVHTSVQAVANDARQAVFEANRDLIKGYRWVTALDGHVCWTADTLILMADGSERPAGTLQAGDMVIGGVSGKPCRVAFAGKRTVPSSVAIHYNGDIIGRVTYDHPVLTKSGWREIGDIGLSADVSKREVLCRRSEKHRESIAAASEERRHGKAVCPEPCVEEVRAAGNDDTRQGADARGCVCLREVTHHRAPDSGAERLQHDERRRGCSRSARGDSQGQRGEAFAAVQRGPRVPSEDACGGKTCGAEGSRDEKSIQRNSGGTGDHQEAYGPGVAREDRSIQSSAKITGSFGAAAPSGEGAVGKPGAQGEGKCCAGIKASGIAIKRSGLGGEEVCEDVRNHEEEMGGGQGLPGESSCEWPADSFSGGQGQGGGKAQGVHDFGEARGSGRENPPAVGEAKCVFVGIIRGEAINEPVEVITLAIDGDPSYVAGGLIVHNCDICAARADLMWDVDHEPIDHSLPWETPPIHFNDRCVLVPETKSWKELGIDLPEPAEGMRASRDGPVPASRTFGEFLARQSKEFQDDTLGKGRAELWRGGKITLQDLVSGNGRPLTLAKLQAKYGG